MMFEPDAESMPAEQRAGLQEERLRALVDRLLTLDGVQAERLRSAGVTSGGDVGLADLPRLPMTEKKDLWDAYPLGMLGVTATEVVALHGSSGTGGRPTLVGYTRGDLRLWARMCARALAAAGATGQPDPQRVRLRAVHRRPGHPPGRDRAGRHRGARVGRDDARGRSRSSGTCSPTS